MHLRDFHRSFHAIAFASILALSIACVDPAGAAWLTDGNPVCNLSPSQQNGPAVVWSFDTRAMFFWSDTRNGAEDLYARIIDSTGTLVTGDIPIAVASSFQNGPVGIPDGNGGGIVTWMDARSGSYDIYAQRISYSGAALWAANGIPVGAAANHQRFQALSGDGLVSLTGALPGVYVAWQDDRTGTGDIYAQHISSAGVLWASESPVCTATGAQTNAVISSDGLGARGSATGALVSWVDGRTSASATDIYAQRLSSSGVAQWAANGVPVCTAAGTQNELHMVQVGGGNSILTWKDTRTGTARLYAQKLDAAGIPQWGADGLEVTPGTAGAQSSPAIVAYSGGALMVWSDTRNGAADIYAQRLDATGAPVWQPAGIPIAATAGSETSPVLVSNGNGFIVCWSAGASDLWAQSVAWDGQILWPTNGIPVSRAAGTQSRQRMVGSGYGAFITWQDTRAGDNDVYALRIAPSIVLDVPGPSGGVFALSLRSPNPARATVRLGLQLDRDDTPSVQVLDVAGRLRATLIDHERLSAGRHDLVWNGNDDGGHACSAGVYFVRAQSAAGVSWVRVVRLR